MAQTKELASSVDELVIRVLRAETREAQNMTILLSAVGLVIFYGLVSVEKTTIGGFELKPTGTSAATVLCAVACFYWLRFVYFGYQDMTLHRFTRTSAAATFQKITKPMIDAHLSVCPKSS